MRNFCLLFSLLFFTAARPVHPLKICVCDARYANQQFTLKFKFFWDDLETTLEKQTGRDLSLNIPSSENDRLVSEFVRKNFDLKINTLPIQLRHLHSEINDVMLIMEFAGDGFQPADRYTVDLTDQILLDVFPDQYNLARFDFFGTGNLETLRFERSERHLTKTIQR